VEVDTLVKFKIPDWLAAFARTDEPWHRKPLSVFALYIFLGFLVYWEIFIPSPGEAVAALAVAAAAMSIRGEMRGKEKVAWMLLLFAFLYLELTSIKKERKANEEMQAMVNWQEAEHFRKIGAEFTKGLNDVLAKSDSDFKTTMSSVDKTLSATQETLVNTQTQARLGYTAVMPAKTVPPLELGGAQMHVFYRNLGNEDAAKPLYDAHTYVGKLSDIPTQQAMWKKFDEWWPTEKHQGWNSPPITIGDTPFFTFYSSPTTPLEQGDLTHERATIYVLMRFMYSDHRGRWQRDECFEWQDPLVDIHVTKPCLVRSHLTTKVKPPS
jgi:hypothetical protein